MEKHHPVNWEVHWKPSFFLFCSSCLKLLTQLHGSRLSKCHDSRHLVNFLGTDTVASMICARDYYGAKKARGLITPKQTSHGCWLLEFIEEIILRIYRYYDEFACRSSSLSCFFFSWIPIGQTKLLSEIFFTLGCLEKSENPNPTTSRVLLFQ